MDKLNIVLAVISRYLCTRDSATDGGPPAPYAPAAQPPSSSNPPPASSPASATAAASSSFRGIQRRNAVRRPVTPRIRGQVEVINGIHPDPPTTWQGAF